MIILVLRKYGEVNSNYTNFKAKEYILFLFIYLFSNWKDSKEIENILLHILSSIKSIYGENENDNYYKMIDSYFHDNHITFICGVNDSEKTFNESKEEIDPYTGEKKNTLTIIDFYMNVIPVGGYKIADICELDNMSQFPLQHLIPV